MKFYVVVDVGFQVPYITSANQQQLCSEDRSRRCVTMAERCPQKHIPSDLVLSGNGSTMTTGIEYDKNQKTENDLTQSIWL